MLTSPTWRHRAAVQRVAAIVTCALCVGCSRDPAPQPSAGPSSSRAAAGTPPASAALQPDDG